MYKLVRIFNGDRTQSTTVSRHRTYAAAEMAKKKWELVRGRYNGWGLIIIAKNGLELL